MAVDPWVNIYIIALNITSNCKDFRFFALLKMTHL